MHNLFKWLISHQKSVVMTFVLLCIFSAVAAQSVKVNYNLMDYLPEDSTAVVGLNTMRGAFQQEVPSVRVMVPFNSQQEAQALYHQLVAIKGVTDVYWVGDVVSINEPIAFQEKSAIQKLYQDGRYLYTITLDTDRQREVVAAIRAIAGPKAALDGSAAATVFAMSNTEKEVSKITLYVVLIVFGILLLTTSAWFEPLLFMVVIGVAILINMGTNIIFGQISFLTNAAALVLQIAVSMDYAIFLLHRFSDYRQDGLAVKEAMLAALDKSFTPILASASTTIFGFAALLLMRYQIGADLGLVLAKSVVLSLISVLVLLPVLSILFSSLIDKTHHKPLTLQFKSLTWVFRHGKLPIIALFIAVTAVGFLAQNHNDYLYGISRIYADPTLTINQERAAIEVVFGKQNQLVILIKDDNTSQEQMAALTKAVKALPATKSVVSITEITGLALPLEFIPTEDTKALVAGGYQRLLVTLGTPAEGKDAFRAAEDLETVIKSHIQSPYYLVGETPNTRDLKTVVTADSFRVNAVAALAIAIILLLTFKGFGVPTLLMIVIEGAIMINLGVPYLTNQPLFYISYLIIGAVQLGATVDYAILFGSRYLENRHTLDRSAAAIATIKDTGLSILTSASIMAVSGFFLGSMSSNQLISQLGQLVGRGACISVFLVLTVLPSLLYLFDTWAVRPLKGKAIPNPARTTRKEAKHDTVIS